MNTSSVRFFLGVSPHPPWVWAGFGTIVALQGWTLRQSPDDAASMLAAALLVQMFAVSTGFCAPASRGQFDPLLTAGRPRFLVAMAHLVASALPGIAAWGALAVVEVAAAPPRWPLALSPRALLALILVSAIAWALTLRLPRLSGGVLWLGLLLVGALTREGFLALAKPAVDRPEGPGVVGLLSEAGLRAAAPFLLLTKRAFTHELAVVSIDIGIAIIVLAAALAFLSLRDYPLAEE